LDGADSNTITGTTSVTAWRDKSANGYVANSFVNSVPNPSWVPNIRNGNGVIQYSAGNGSSIANFVLAQTMSIFKVYYPINQNTNGPFLEHSVDTNTNLGFYFHANGGENFLINAGTTGYPFPSVNFGNTTVSNTWQMIQGINPDPANLNKIAFYVNGTAIASGATQSATIPVTKTLYINGRGGANNLSYNTYLAELIIYNIAVTTSQRQQVEGYLAHKWGLVPPPPTIPLSIPGCALWLDAADSSTVSGTSTVTQWRDKSGNGRNTTTTGTVSYANSGVSITSSSSYLTGSFGSPDYTGSTVSCFLIASMSSSSGTVGRFLGLGKVGTQDSDNLASITIGRGGGLAVRAYRTVPTSSPPSIPAYDTRFLATWGQTSSLLFNSINGGTVTTASLTGAFAINAYRIGHDLLPDDANEQLNGVINEIIVYFSELTTTQRQTIEGYLSRKWGIGSPSIPSTHPFYSIRPHLRTFQPIDVPGCQLWLDAADQSSMTLSGSSVTQWRDKSGIGATATRLTGDSYATLTTIQGNRILSFPGGNAVYRSPMVLTGAAYTIFTISSLLSTSGNGSGYQRMINTDLTIFVGAVNGILGTFSGSGAWNDISTNTPSYTLLGTGLQLVTMVVSGSSLIPYINGTAMDAKTGTTGATTVLDIGGQQTNAQHWNGYIGDIIVYNSALTTSQRQQVEGYLAHKWGLSLYLPVISPLSIPGCQLWFDAADSSTITFSSGSNVSVWTNKGVVSTTATPTRGATANQITYTTIDGYPGVYINNNGSAVYNASTYSQLTIQSNFQNTADYSIFAVVNLSNVVIAEYQTIYGNARGASGETRSPNFGAGMSLEFNADGTNRMISSSFIGTGRLQTALISSSSALTAYTNATAYASNTNAYTRPSTDVGALPIIGGAFGASSGGSDNRFATGYFHEIIFYNSVLTTTQRQQVEGYLARKWGISISATLPSPHPFKSFPPASLPFSPRNISGVTLWLDAADQSSMTLSGSSVTQIRDKSGNGNNSTSSTATYTTGINGRASMNNPVISGPIANSGSSTVSIFVIATNNRTGTLYDNMIALNVSPITNYYGAGSLFLARAGDSGTPKSYYGFMNGNLSSAFAPAFDTPFMFNVFQTGTTGSTYGNGTDYGSVTTPGSTLNYTNYYIGTCSGGPAWLGNIGEILVFNSVLTTSQRQQIEGYLAHKWGMSASLPATHPYKKFPPP
jgi:hypothetical protein